MLCFNQTISNSHDKFKLLISCVTALFLFLSFLCDDQTASTLRLAGSFIISERNVEYLRQTPYLYVMRVCIDFHYENVRVGEFSLIPFYRCTQLQQRLLFKMIDCCLNKYFTKTAKTILTIAYALMISHVVCLTMKVAD